MIAVKQVETPITVSTGDRNDSRQGPKSEIEILKDCDHPHIVQYLGFEETKTFLRMSAHGNYGHLWQAHSFRFPVF